jgi:hypothetical protein
MTMSHDRLFFLRCRPSRKTLDVRHSYWRELFELAIPSFFYCGLFAARTAPSDIVIYFIGALHEPEEGVRRDA